MIVHRFNQKSVEWLSARAGIPTASEFDNLVTPEWKVRTGGMPASYLAKKLAERWLGGPLAESGTFIMDQGNILEEEAIPFAEMELGTEIDRVGFITTDDGKVGCSPDGMFSNGSGIEIKCPTAHVHCGYLLNGQVPKEYAAQVHGSMFVTGAKSWRFLSYRRNFPPLLLTVRRDEAIQEQLSLALEVFNTALAHAYEDLCTLNQGPPRMEALANGGRMDAAAEPEYLDIIP